MLKPFFKTKIINLFFPENVEKTIIKKRLNFYRQFLNSGDIYFDVGANYGNRIEPLINEGLKIIAVEPQLHCIEYLKEKYDKQIIIIPCGLGSKKGSQTMYLSDAHTLSSFSQDWINAVKKSGRFGQCNWNKKQKVKITTLDDLILNYGLPRFIKIDVEGYEYEVLKGLSKPVNIISFEYAIPENKHSLLQCIDRIIKIGEDYTVLFNYSVGESMELSLKNWIPKNEILKEIESNRFINSDFGDIYVKTIL